MYHGILYSTAKTPRGRSAALSGELGGGCGTFRLRRPCVLESGASEDFEDFEDFGTINQVRAVSSRINPSEQYFFCVFFSFGPPLKKLRLLT